MIQAILDAVSLGGVYALAALGGFIVGAVLSLLNVILGNGRVYAYSWMFVIVIVILLVRPGGILSKFATKERV